MSDVQIKVVNKNHYMLGEVLTPEYIDEVGDARLTTEDVEKFATHWIFDGDFVIVRNEAETGATESSLPTRLHKITLELTTAELFAVSKALAEVNN